MAEISDLVARALALRDAGASDAEVLEHMGPMDQEDYSVLKSVLSIAPRSFRPSSQPRLLSGAATEACAESSMSGAVVVECVQESLRGEAVRCAI